MDADERLRLDYEQTTQLLRTLTDIRFKLLAFVPTIAGASVGLVGHPRPAADLLGVGLLGLVATLGVVLYELRNSQIYAAALERASRLERDLGIASVLGAERPRASLRLGGLVAVQQTVGLALVYGAALAGWSYLVAWGLLRGLDVGESRTVGGIVGIVVGLFAIAEVSRILERPEPVEPIEPGGARS
jgi:membrane protease YdiL (CAAX protease family)